jgi:hypothetical protein
MNDFKIAEACLRADDAEINIPKTVNPVTPGYRAHLTGSQKLLGNAYSDDIRRWVKERHKFT